MLLHGMGPCIAKAIYVAQDLLLHYGDQLELETRHGTVDVVDDLIGEYDTTVQERRVSSLTLRLHLAEAEMPSGSTAANSRTSSWLNLIARPK